MTRVGFSIGLLRSFGSAEAGSPAKTGSSSGRSASYCRDRQVCAALRVGERYPQFCGHTKRDQTEDQRRDDFQPGGIMSSQDIERWSEYACKWADW